MRLHEGELIRRTLIQYVETSSAGVKRTLLDILSWLGEEYSSMLNRIVIYVTALGDVNSDFEIADNLQIYVKTYGMTMEKRFLGAGSNQYGLLPTGVEFPLATIGIPAPGTNVLLQARAYSWLITDTHKFLFEVQAYLLDLGPSEMLIRSF